MSSIRRLTSQIQRNKEEENDDNCPPTIQIKLDDAESENEDDLDVGDEVTQFGSAFVKNKTAGSVNKSLTDMMNKACTSKADCQALFKTLEKNRNDQATFQFFVGANSQQFYILMSRFNKDFDNGLQNTQGTLCSGIYATSKVADKFNDLKKSNPEDEIINDLIANFI